MNYNDYEIFAKENNIGVVEVDGTFGCGYPCAYVYFEPESVISLIKSKNHEIENLKEAATRYPDKRCGTCKDYRNHEYCWALNIECSADFFCSDRREGYE